MSPSSDERQALSIWESEGGAAPPASRCQEVQLTGTVAQIQWAEIIRRQVDADFGRVAQALQAAALRSTRPARIATGFLITLLEEIRANILANTSAGYFSREWQELCGRVCQLIIRDPRYHARRAAADADGNLGLH